MMGVSLKAANPFFGKAGGSTNPLRGKFVWGEVKGTSLL